MDYKKKYEDSNECIEVLGSEFKKAEAKCEELENSLTKIREIHQKDQQLLREKEVQYSEMVQKYQHITAKYEKKTAMYSVSIQEKHDIIKNLREKVQAMEAASTTSQLNSTPPINLASELILTEKEESHAKQITDVVKVNSTYVYMVRDQLAQQMTDFENHIQQVTENSVMISNNLEKMVEKYKKLYLQDVELKKKQNEQEKQIKKLEMVNEAFEHEIQLLRRNARRNNVSRRHTGNIRSPICHSTPKEPISRVSTMPVHPLPRPSIVKREESDDTLRRPVNNRPQTSQENNVLVRPTARNQLNNEGSNRNPRHHWPSFLRSTESSNVSDTSNSTCNTLTPSNNRRSNSITRDHCNRFRKNNGRSASVTRDDQSISRMVFNSSNGSTSSKYPTLFHGTLGCDAKLSERFVISFVIKVSLYLIINFSEILLLRKGINNCRFTSDPASIQQPESMMKD